MFHLSEMIQKCKVILSNLIISLDSLVTLEGITDK